MNNKKTIVLVSILFAFFFSCFILNFIIKSEFSIIKIFCDSLDKTLIVGFFTYFVYILMNGCAKKNHSEILNITIAYIAISVLYIVLLIGNYGFASTGYFKICIFDLLLILACYCARHS